MDFSNLEIVDVSVQLIVSNFKCSCHGKRLQDFLMHVEFSILHVHYNCK